MIFESPKEAMPWVGLYIVVASLICTIAMVADVVQAFWQWKLWFPNKFFTLNAATITLMAIAMKLPMDLSSEILIDEVLITKLISIAFLVTMLANILPSLGLMDSKELLMNMIALGILLITIVVNIVIQIDISFVEEIVEIVPLVLPFSVAVTVSATRKKLEDRYKESQLLVSFYQEKMFSYKEHKCYVKKYWMMTETHNPQFVIACSPVSSALGVLCSVLGVSAILIIFNTLGDTDMEFSTSDYKWSMKIILLVQLIGMVVGSIAPIFRCFTSISHYSLSMKWSKNQLNVFRVEKHWIHTLQQWKSSHVHSHLPGRNCKIVFHNVKTVFLIFCITLHIMVLVICKTIFLIPKTFLILLSCCWYFFKSFLKMFRIGENMSTTNTRSEIEEYTRYVVQIEEEEKLSNRILRNTLRSITQLLDKYEKKEMHNLMKLLEKSTGFNGVVKFDNDQIPPLYPEEIHNCWSLVVITLTSIAIALPNITKGHFKGLLAGMREGLEIVRCIEECLHVDDDSVNTRKTANRVWKEVEVYGTWLQIELQRKARKGKKSNEILKWLGDEAAKIVIQVKSNKKEIIGHSHYKFILASSMYRISQTILLQCNQQENLSNDEELFEWILTIIADILSACFTNLSCVIQMKCRHPAIEKRGDNIRDAARLLGKCKKILKILKARQLPNIDLDSMAHIDKWRMLTNTQMSNGFASSSSSLRIQRGSSSSSEALIVTIM